MFLWSEKPGCEVNAGLHVGQQYMYQVLLRVPCSLTDYLISVLLDELHHDLVALVSKAKAILQTTMALSHRPRAFATASTIKHGMQLCLPRRFWIEAALSYISTLRTRQGLRPHDVGAIMIRQDPKLQAHADLVSRILDDIV